MNCEQISAEMACAPTQLEAPIGLNRTVPEASEQETVAADELDSGPRNPEPTAETHREPSEDEAALSLMERLDRRQNQVLEELDALNERVDSLIQCCLKEREAEGVEPTGKAA